MCRIMRWTGYASTLIGAIFIIMTIIGGFTCHQPCGKPHAQVCCKMQHPGGEMGVTKSDTACCKQHAMMMSNAPMGKQDSAKCCKKQEMCPPAAMSCEGGQMMHHRIAFHMGLAICFLLLAIALFMISKCCCCKKCCSCKEGSCDCKDEKKE